MEIIAGVLVFLGLIGSFLPVLPGPPLSFVGLLIYAFVTDFEEVGLIALVIFGIFSILTVILDFVAPALGAKGYKASKYGIIGALLGSFFGIFVLGPPGIIFGPLIGGFVGEFYFRRDAERAIKSAWGGFVGVIVGTIFRLAVALGITGYFVYVLLR